MRVSSAHAFDATLSALNRRQEQLAQTQEQIAQGKRVLKPGDDPAAAVRAERALARSLQVEARQRALDASVAGLQQIEGSLGTAGELLLQAREQLVAFSNVNASRSSQDATVRAMEQVIDQVAALVELKDSDGQHWFGEPVTDVQRQALERQGLLTAGFDKLQVWEQVAMPGSPGSTRSVLGMLRDARDRLATDPPPTATDLRDHLARLEAASEHLLGHRARAGVMLNRADSATLHLQDQSLQARTARSDAEDLDLVEAMTQLQSRQAGYEAALRTYSMVQGMSLFDYMGR